MEKKKKLGKLAEDRKRNLRLIVADADVEDFPEVRSFECRLRLTYNSEFYECRGDLVQQGDGHLNEALELAKRLFKIEGVQEVEIREYRVYVTISQSFDWQMDEIISQVKHVISDYIQDKFMADDVIEQANQKLKEKK